MLGARVGVNIVGRADIHPAPAGYHVPVSPEMRCNMISSNIVTVAELPEGAHGIQVDDTGGMAFHDLHAQFEVQGTSPTLVCAHALAILGHRHTASLLGVLGAPRMQAVLGVAEGSVLLFTEVQAEERATAAAAAAQITAEEKGGAAAVGESASAAAGAPHSSSASVGDLRGVHFDRVVAAYCYVRDNLDTLDVEEDMLPLIDQLGEVLADVVVGEAEEAGQGRSVEARVLLDEWVAAYHLRQRRNALEAHPLDDAAAAPEVLKLFEAAAHAAHPATART